MQPSAAPALRTRILIVDQAPDIRQIIINHMDAYGMQTMSVSGYGGVMRQLARDEPDLIILDRRDSADNGLELLHKIRLRSNAPVIAIMDANSVELDRVTWLELGADDCLVDPFGVHELLARMRALLRRCKTNAGSPRKQANFCRFGDWQLDPCRRMLTDSRGAVVTLTKGEYALLAAFLEAPRRPLAREHLLRAIRVHEDVFDRSIDVKVLRLRRKLETMHDRPRIILTERSVGYVFALPVDWITGNVLPPQM